ncbi:NmrA family NAD(P)-binding protein [Paenibacillus tarimensis]|uniref:NmrA family NAD(P)-binding protein n=1 Tax=Paenibacillus tarimensis TaxID=416012 RepID=UPI001F1F252B|nr:NmrA family NAD(P)-binding protein [Paenibacillus tarimensis]MCF2941974.1 NmrA family NAD(P)-binding protein [Paenibacillus tarimensis]
MNVKPAVLITGGRGKTGGRIAKRLSELGYPVRSASRSAKQSVNQTGGIIEDVHFDWFDKSTYEDALQDIDAMYLVPPLAVMEPAEVMLPFLELALRKGVQRTVLLSSASIPEGGPVTGKVHQAIRRIMPEWTVLQPSYFMQNFTEGHHGIQINRDGVMYTAAGDGRIGFVDADDIAEVGLRALIDPDAHNQSHVITGPQSLSYSDVAKIIGKASGREIRHQHVSTDMLVGKMIQSGIPEEYARFLAGLDDAIRLHGSEDQVTDTVERITGRRPRSMAEYARIHSGHWGKVNV